jgi:hypothetical protein
MTTIEDAAAMTEASGLAGDQERIDHATDSIRDMTRDMADEFPAQARGLSNMLRGMAREAPLHSLAIAFLLGVMLARRR